MLRTMLTHSLAVNPACRADTLGQAPGGQAPGLMVAARRVGQVLAFGVLPVVLTIALLSVTYGKASSLYDFHGGLYGAGADIVHGRSPYRPGYLMLQAAIKRSGGVAQTVIDVPVYPPPVLLAAVPFSLLPDRVAGVLFVVLSIGAVILSRRLLRVRDWRCYGLACASWPVLSWEILPYLAIEATIVGRLCVAGTSPAVRRVRIGRREVSSTTA